MGYANYGELYKANNKFAKPGLISTIDDLDIVGEYTVDDVLKDFYFPNKVVQAGLPDITANLPIELSLAFKTIENLELEAVFELADILEKFDPTFFLDKHILDWISGNISDHFEEVNTCE